MPSQVNKRIAKNTLFLYIRMAFTLVVSLYTSRVVLKYLGVSDFGIFEVVGSITTSLSFLITSMTLASQRFLNFTLGKNDDAKVSKVFSTAINIHLGISLGLLILAETVGLYFLNYHLNIPEGRIAAANIVYQFSIGNMLLGIVFIPYNALIIAHEKMSFIAGVSIFNAILRLLIVYMLVIIDADKLIAYAALAFAVCVVVQFSYAFYCWRHFKDHSKYRFERDPALFKEMLSFSGWCTFGGITAISKSQAINFILNIFHGVTLNTAMGIANRVAEATNQLVASFQTASNPQIVKQYSSGEFDSLSTLVIRVSKFSYFLMLLVSIPLLLNTEFIFKIWLVEVPEYATEFVKWMILFVLTDSIAGPQWMSILATGKVRNYYLIESAITALNVPLCIFVLYYHYSPVYVFIVRFAINLVVLIWRAIYMQNKIMLPFKRYLKKVIAPIITVSISAGAISLAAANIPVQGVIRFFLLSAISVIAVSAATWILGFDPNERHSCKELILGKLRNLIGS